MSEHEGEQIEGVETSSGIEGASVPASSEQDAPEQVPPAEGEPVDAGAGGDEDAEAKHEEFLKTYQPVITRLPEALADERAEQTAAEEAAKAAEAQAQAERDEVTRRQVEAQAQAEEEKRAYAAEHYPAS